MDITRANKVVITIVITKCSINAISTIIVTTQVVSIVPFNSVVRLLLAFKQPFANKCTVHVEKTCSPLFMVKRPTLHNSPLIWEDF